MKFTLRRNLLCLPALRNQLTHDYILERKAKGKLRGFAQSLSDLKELREV